MYFDSYLGFRVFITARLFLDKIDCLGQIRARENYMDCPVELAHDNSSFEDVPN